MKFEGYHDPKDLPVKAGDRVRIRKGTTVKVIGRPAKPAGRTYTITVHHVLCGCTFTSIGARGSEPSGKHLSNPSVRWAGPGGYWAEADINDVEKVE